MFNAKTITNFLTEEECLYLLDIVKNVEPWETGGDEFWSNRSLNGINIYNNIDKQAGKLMYEIRNKIGMAIKDQYNLKDEVYPDLCQVVRWFPGQEQHPHADDMTNIEGTDWFHHRHFGAIIYLNDNYSGGETYYPQYEKSIKPAVGTLAIHPGDTNHFHGVTKIEGGMRYTIASFWTLDKEYFDGWTIS